MTKSWKTKQTNKGHWVVDIRLVNPTPDERALVQQLTGGVDPLPPKAHIPGGEPHARA